ncbi:alpha/beta hydrolase family protein [Actinoallomurus iriomotensis]|uniref:Alpha/beta hydrolase n=1 Tax=Actinoallomurus iriomotensis TaxID=478107 RepID=A0A9W6S7N4_9ACTN|nr:alpha/beta family hydrolase [Actinoallomurus iriomotensis]GLY87207.1 alpha/beta hydrolase [Actinoallomurus iriomotensis]
MEPTWELATPAGPAEVTLDEVADPAFLLALTHGSNGGLDAPDLRAVRAEALRLGGAVAGIRQPFRVAGRRAPGSPDRQDEAWLTVIEALRERYGDVPLIQCGRSNGARVACRTALKAGARGVLALAFPLHPPSNPARSRAGELRDAGVEVVVVNGDRDPFGVPDPADATEVRILPGERHDLSRTPSAVGEVAAEWLGRWSGRS